MSNRQRPNFSLVARQAAEAAKVGLASPSLIRNARPGAVYLVKDKSVDLPETRIPGAPPRAAHPFRHVIVVQSETMCRSGKPPTVLVVPCSASRGGAESWNFEVPGSEVAFNKPVVVALTSLVQPVLKSDLESYLGELTPQTLDLLQRRLLENLGIATPVEIDLGPRQGAAAVVQGPEVVES